MYKLLKSSVLPSGEVVQSKNVQRVADHTFIPFDPDNMDYQIYLKWLEEGNTPLPADE
jgi:hypothetical protein